MHNASDKVISDAQCIGREAKTMSVCERPRIIPGPPPSNSKEKEIEQLRIQIAAIEAAIKQVNLENPDEEIIRRVVAMAKARDRMKERLQQLTGEKQS